MIDIVLTVVGRKIPLGYIRRVIGIMHEYAIPGRILRWPRRRHLLVPLFRATEDLVHVKDQPPVTEPLVNDLLTDRKLEHDGVTSYRVSLTE